MPKTKRKRAETEDAASAGVTSKRNKKNPEPEDEEQLDPTTSAPETESMEDQEQDEEYSEQPSRIDRIKGLLEHRKIQLERLRMGKVAARARLDSRKNEEGFANLTEDKEIEAFREMLRESNSISRKLSRADAESNMEKRSAPSLRRGASVGKKMNAALSSLIPGASPIMDAEDVVPTIKSSAQRSSSIAHKTPQGRAAASTARREVIPSPIPTGKSRTPSVRSSQVRSVSTAVHTALPSERLPLNRLQQPTVVCPELVSLRERRNLLQNKLMTIANKRLARDPALEMNLTRKERQLKTLNAIKGPRSSLSLPTRRKTHWDTLLQEMKWMATDFQQERRWKTAMSRTLIRTALKSKDPEPCALGDSKPQKEVASIESAPDRVEDQRGPADKEPSEDLATDGFYARVSDEEAIEARTVAKTMSRMIHELAHAIRQSGCVSDSDDAFVTALHRFRNGDKATRNGDKKPEDAKDEKMDEDLPNESNGDHQEQDSTDHLEHVEKVFLEVERKLQVGASESKIESKQNGLSGECLDSLAKVEDCWSRLGCGSLLYGPVATGKTAIACQLLSGSVVKGPKLIVCQPNSVLRWTERVSATDGLTCHSVPSLKGINSSNLDEIDDLSKLQQNDVVVADLKSFRGLNQSVVTKFGIVILDLRFPSGFFGSRSRSIHERMPPLTADMPVELRDEEWWCYLSSCLSSSEARLLLVSDFPVNDFELFLTGLTDRRVMNILSTFTGILVSSLRTLRGKVTKEILRWARRRVRGSSEKGSKLQKVKSLLFTQVSSLSISHCAESLLDKIDASRVVWDVVQCPLENSQRQMYDQLCSDLRSILTTPFDYRHALETDVMSSVSDSLMHLRSVTFHSDCETLLRQLGSHMSNLGNLSLSMDRRSPSQTDTALAIKIMQSSSKLSELANILASRLKGRVHFDESLLDAISLESDKKQKSAAKIVILACSYQSQLISSILLNSLGVSHHCLFAPSHGLPESNWIRSQLELSSFANARDDSDFSVVIASPMTVAGDHGGITINDADLVLSLDEDWSGCMVLPTLHLYSRCKKAEFIKLMASETCEESFLVYGIRKSGVSGDWKGWPWPVSAFGQFHPPKAAMPTKESDLSERALGMSNSFAFPGCCITSLSGMDISKVLASSNMAPSFVSTNNKRFLPTMTLDSKEGRGLRFMLLRLLFERESNDGDIIRSSTVLPPLQEESHLVPAKCTDLLCLESRHFLERMTQYDKYFVENDFIQILSDQSNNVASIEVEPEVFVDPWQEKIERVGLKNVASDVLFYSGGERRTVAERSNVFARVFASSLGKPVDGAQGVESLVYFPPLLPRIKECNILAASQIDDIRSTRILLGQGGEAIDKDIEPQVLYFVTEDEASHSDAASVLLDLSDDYGLAGIGAVPLPRDSALFSGTTEVSQSGAFGPYWRSNEWVADRAPMDLEDVDFWDHASLQPKKVDKILLVVSRKRSRGYNGQQARVSGVSSSSIVKTGIPIEASSLIGGDSRPVSMLKSKDAVINRVLASTRQPGLSTSLFESPAYKVAAYHVLERVSGRASENVWSSHHAFEQGPGLPLFASKQYSSGRRGLYPKEDKMWTSIVKRLKNRDSVTGSESLELAMSQYAAFRRSYTSPCRVDFGPFQIGFLSHPSGMTSALPTKARAGVSLPMGVKINATARETHRIHFSPPVIQRLKDAVEKCGGNWMMIARHVNGPYLPLSHSGPIFSSRSCKDQWQTMLRNDGELAKAAFALESQELKKALTSPDDNAESLRTSRLKSGEGSHAGKKEFLVASIQDKDKNRSERSETEPHFTAFKASMLKRKKVPLKISQVDGSEAQPAPSHPTHLQAVQSSATASLMGGKADPWPLYILDALSRQRSPPVQGGNFPRTTASNGHPSGNSGYPVAPQMQGFAPQPGSHSPTRPSQRDGK